MPGGMIRLLSCRAGEVEAAGFVPGADAEFARDS